MTEIERDEIIEKAKEFFRNEVFGPHLQQGCVKASKLKSYNINPFLVKYLACFLDGDVTPRSIAKALILPRVLGTSINTAFGGKTQKMINTLFDGYGSVVSGIDIEYIDAVDGRKKYCQVKSGPQTINKDDVTTISNHFKAVRNLARVNNMNIGLEDLVIGVLYGQESDLSGNYKKLKNDYPVIVGADFWYRITGDKIFYEQLTTAIGEIALEYNGEEQLEKMINSLASEIDASELY